MFFYMVFSQNFVYVSYFSHEFSYIVTEFGLRNIVKVIKLCLNETYRRVYVGKCLSVSYKTISVFRQPISDLFGSRK
jgi:hypothetical protein